MEEKRIRKGGREEKSETRESIIRTAHQLFMTSGYRAISTRQIADACGVTQPALYHHFSNKEELYVEVIRMTIDETKKALEKAQQQAGSIREQLYHVVYYLISSQPENMMQMFYDMEHELQPQSKRYIREWWMNGFFMPIVSIFEEGLRTGVLERQKRLGLDAMAATYLMLNMIGPISFQSQEMFTPTARSQEERAWTIVDVLLFGLAG